MEIYDRDKSWNLMSASQVRQFDSYAITELGIPGVVLMENAGRSCAELLMEKLSFQSNSKVVIFCGTGNNGGDGFVIARHLINAGFEPKVMICGEAGKIKGDAKINFQVLEKMGHGVDMLDFEGDAAVQVDDYAGDADYIVDALFGTGLTGGLSGVWRELIEAINGLRKKILAVDIPSGLNCDEGTAEGGAIIAESTVTFAAVKRGFSNPDSCKYTGQVYVASIGVNP